MLRMSLRFGPRNETRTCCSSKNPLTVSYASTDAVCKDRDFLSSRETVPDWGRYASSCKGANGGTMVIHEMGSIYGKYLGELTEGNDKVAHRYFKNSDRMLAPSHILHHVVQRWRRRTFSATDTERQVKPPGPYISRLSHSYPMYCARLTPPILRVRSFCSPITLVSFLVRQSSISSTIHRRWLPSGATFLHEKGFEGEFFPCAGSDAQCRISSFFFFCSIFERNNHRVMLRHVYGSVPSLRQKGSFTTALKLKCSNISRGCWSFAVLRLPVPVPFWLVKGNTILEMYVLR